MTFISNIVFKHYSRAYYIRQIVKYPLHLLGIYYLNIIVWSYFNYPIFVLGDSCDPIRPEYKQINKS